MVCSGVGSSDLLLDFGCMTCNLPLLELFTFYSSSLRRTDTTVFAKSNKPPSQIRPPSLLSPSSNVFEINTPSPGRVRLNRGFTVSEGMNYFFLNFLSWINLLLVY